MKMFFRYGVCVACVGLAITVGRADAQDGERSLIFRQPESAVDGTVDPLHQQVQSAIDISSRRYLQADVHTPWQFMHGLLALGRDFQIKKNGQKISAIDWIADNPTYRDEPWFQTTQYGGQAHPYSQPYLFEGHPNQFLAILTMSNLPLDFKLKAGNETITIADIVNNSKMELNDQEEVTWSLWALSHYLSPDSQWINKHGEDWSVERMVRIQTRESVDDAACGGTHGLFALSYARNVYQNTGRPLRGAWLEADQKIRRYVESARSLQNSDGTFSNDFFRGRTSSYDFTTTCASSGHTLEFLMMALPQKRLKENWVRRGVAAMAQGLIDHRREPLECGPLYHALSGLRLYQLRTFPKTTAPVDVAEKPVGNSGPDTAEDNQEPVEASKPRGNTAEKRSSTVKSKSAAQLAEKIAEMAAAIAKMAGTKAKEVAAKLKVIAAQAKRAEAQAKRAVAKANRDKVNALRAEIERAEAEATRAEVQASRAEEEAKRAEDDAASSIARAKRETTEN